ncbi:MFS transporter [Jiangella ureilytica]|uniref:MFS transporter n=1 Tax=Jiangella ureilytica TaxID=2530374 RepID=A0A4R4RKW4_9ACTN|nr:MFS transporter [Jiangella ureilytica]TDC50288.1 MFS transporter [Jiangella ureilytica]
MGKRQPLGRALRNVVAANVSSSLGDGIARVAAPLLAARLTDDPLLVAGIAAVAMLPWLIFAIPAGILLDRIDRRRAMTLANGARALLSVLLLVLFATDGLTIWWLYVVVFVYGVFETIYDGAIRAVLPSIVATPDLPRANSRVEAGEIVVERFLSGPLTSALFAVSVVIPLGINALTYAVAGILAVFLPVAAAGAHRTDPTGEPHIAWYRQFSDGFRYLMGNPMLRKLWMISVVIALLFSAATATMVLYVLNRLGLPEAWYGGFILAGAVGSLGAAALANRLKERYRAGPVMAVAQTVALAALVLMGAVPVLGVVAFGYLLSAGGTTVWNILVMSLRQAAIPSRLLGRVHGTWRTLLWGTMPLGSLVGGVLGRIDLRAPFLIAGGAATLVTLASFRFLSGLPNPEDLTDADAGVRTR